MNHRGGKVEFRAVFTSIEMSSRGVRCWLIAAREAWSTSRMQPFNISIASSHSLWPGAFSLHTYIQREGRNDESIMSSYSDILQVNLINAKEQ